MIIKACAHIEPFGNSILTPEEIEDNKALQEEFMRCYHLYAEKANSEIIDILNNKWNEQHPNETGWPFDLDEYDKFMADGFNRLICDEMNKSNASPLFECFYVVPENVQFVGVFREDHNKLITLRF